MTLGQMVKKILGSVLAIDFMLLFINLPFTAVVTQSLEDGTAVPKTIPCIILGVITAVIFFALMLGYMVKASEKILSPTNEAPVDEFLALKAAACIFIPLFIFSLVTSLSGAGVFLSMKFYDGMKFPHNVLYGPAFGFMLAFYNKSWITPVIPPIIMTILIETAYYMAIKGVKLPKLFYKE